MRAVEIIAKKRDGLELTNEEIRYFIDAYTHGDLPDYQAAALLMAIFFRGMSRAETHALTAAMTASGEQYDLSDITDYAVDKHSSGGVGDKTSLVVLPLVASCGVPVAKMSGRGLGFSGGTLDKIEAINGFNISLEEADFKAQAKAVGIVLAGQTKKLAPADGLLYALRDVTGTVQSLPLIASSIMSKKLAAGAKGIVLDVKAGSGAFMQNVEEARALAQMMFEIGIDAGRDMVAVISDMNQPLGLAVGNAVETAEAIESLGGGGPADLREHCLVIAGHMLRLAGRGKQWQDEGDVRTLLEKHLDNGAALEKFRQLVQAQGGDVTMVDDVTRLPQAAIHQTVTADSAGYIAKVDANPIAWAAFELGAGREKKGDTLDLAVGLRLHVKVGDYVEKGAPLVTILANNEAKVQPCIARIRQAVTYSDSPAKPLPLFYGTITH